MKKNPVKSSTLKYISVMDAAKIIGIGLNSMYKAIYDKEIIPDLVIFRKKMAEVHKNHEAVYAYLFLPHTVRELKNRKENSMSLQEASEYLGLSYRQIRYLVRTGKLLPDFAKKMTKGRRGEFLIYFFDKKTVEQFKQSRTYFSCLRSGVLASRRKILYSRYHGYSVGL